MPRKIMEEFQLFEISAVDRPAQAHAKMTIMKRAKPGDEDCEDDGYSKRDFTEDQRRAAADAGHALPDGSFPINTVADLKNAIQAFGRAKNKAKVKAHIIRRARALGAVDQLPDGWSVSKEFEDVEAEELSKRVAELSAQLPALPSPLGNAIAKYYIDPIDGAVPFSAVLQQSVSNQRYHEVCEAVGPAINALDTSLHSIAGDKNLSTLEKQNMMRSSVEDFMGEIRTKWPDVEQALAKAYTAGDEGEPGMEKLREQITALEKQIEAAKKAGQDPEALAKMQDQVTALTKQVEELTKERDALKLAADEATALSKMSDEEKRHYGSLKDDEAKKAFRDATPEARKADIAKAASGDEVITVAGQQVRKSVVGEAQFAIFKAQAEENSKLSKGLDEEREKRQTAEYAKRADNEIAHLPGDTALRGKVLKAVDAISDAEVKDALTKMLAAGDKAIKAAFDSVGHQGARVTKQGQEAVNGFNKRVDEIAARDKIGKDEAMQKARKEYPDEFKAYQEAN